MTDSIDQEGLKHVSRFLARRRLSDFTSLRAPEQVQDEGRAPPDDADDATNGGALSIDRTRDGSRRRAAAAASIGGIKNGEAQSVKAEKWVRQPGLSTFLAVQCVVLIVFVVVPILVYNAGKTTTDRQDAIRFQGTANRLLDSVVKGISDVIGTVRSLSAYQVSSPFVGGLVPNTTTIADAAASTANFAAFRSFTSPLLAYYPLIRAMSFTPIITHAQRPLYEAAASAFSGTNRSMRGVTQNGVVTDIVRDTYYPVFMIEPLESNSGAVMFNLGSNAERLTALTLAYNRSKPVASAPIVLVQTPPPGILSPYAVLIFDPLILSSNGTRHGYCTAVVQLESLLLVAAKVLSFNEPVTVFLVYKETYTIASAIKGSVAIDSAKVTLPKADSNTFIFEITIAETVYDLIVHKGEEYTSTDSDDYEVLFVVSLISAAAFALLSVFAFLLASRIIERDRGQIKVVEGARTEAVIANAAKNDFLAFLCHELRNPCHAVVASSDMLLETGLKLDRAEILDLVSGIRMSSHMVLSLLNDLLDLSKLNCGRMTVEYIPVDIVPMARSVAAGFAAMASRGAVNLFCEIQAGLPGVVVSDPTRMQQVLSNLISNSIKYTCPGGFVLLRVSFRDWETVFGLGHVKKAPRLASAFQSGGDSAVRDWHPSVIVFEVTDTGRGISPENVEKVFSDYEQGGADVARRFGGTGLGLPIVRRIAERLGGTVHLASAVDVGTSVVCMLPVMADFGATVVSAQKSANLPCRASFSKKVQLVRSNLPPLFGATTFLKPEEKKWHVVYSPSQSSRRVQFRPSNTGKSIPALTDAHNNELHSESQIKAEPDGKEAEAAAGVESMQGIQVLMVDDCTINRKLMRRMLKTSGMNVKSIVEAGDGAQAVCEYMNRRDTDEAVDVVFMDVVMPGMDGIEAARRMREDGYCGVILGTTGNAMQQQQDQCLRAGCDSVLTKPFTRDQFMSALVKALSTRPRAASVSEVCFQV